ncbi:MAG: ribosome biogenesis GTP-binding protein YihA/YsxC [bacterium]
MEITSAKFIKGLVGPDELLEDDKPQIAFIGRSNVGKSSVINSLTKQKALAITSSYPGRTREINLFLLNGSTYLLDLPGYGYAKASWEIRQQLLNRINWYLFKSSYKQKYVCQIIDSKIGPTEGDLEMLEALREHKKKIIVVANKTDKIKKSEYEARFREIRKLVGRQLLIPYSSEDKTGVIELTEALLS